MAVTTRVRRVILLACVAAVIGVAAAGLWMRARPQGPRLLILYATCSLNRDFLSPYNPNVTYTPALQSFAERGQVFTKHQTEEGQSGIAYASLFSGSQAPRHGVYYHPSKLS